MSDEAKDLAEIEALYERYLTAWRNLDTDLMLSLYDTDESFLVYQSEENRGPIYNHDQLTHYWKLAKEPPFLDEILEFRTLAEPCKKVCYGGDFAMIYVILATSLKLHGAKRGFRGELRASLGLRKSAGKWVIYHYHESRQLEAAQKGNLGMDDALGIDLPERFE